MFLLQEQRLVFWCSPFLFWCARGADSRCAHRSTDCHHQLGECSQSCTDFASKLVRYGMASQWFCFFSIFNFGTWADFASRVHTRCSVFHNIVGSISARLQSTQRVRNVVLVGSGIPLAMFIAAKYVLFATWACFFIISLSPCRFVCTDRGNMWL